MKEKETQPSPPSAVVTASTVPTIPTDGADDAEVREIRVTELVNGYRDHLDRHADEYMKARRGESALTAGEDFTAEAEARRDTLLESLGNDLVTRRMFVRTAAGAARLHAERGHEYAAGQKAAWKQSVLDAAFERFALDVAENRANREFVEHQQAVLQERVANMHPDAAPASLFAAIKVLRHKAATEGLKSELADLRASAPETLLPLLHAALDGRNATPAKDDKSSARTGADSAGYIPAVPEPASLAAYYTPEELETELHRVAAAVRQRRLTRINDLEEQERELVAVFQSGAPEEDSALPPEAEYTELFGPEEGPARYALLRQEQRLGEYLQAFRHMTPEEQKARLALCPEGSSGADAARRKAEFQRAMDRDRQLRIEDPAAYVLESDPAIRAALETLSRPDSLDNAAVYARKMRAAYAARGMPEDACLLPRSCLQAQDRVDRTSRSGADAPDPVWGGDLPRNDKHLSPL